jgi:hypothetical protein
MLTLKVIQKEVGLTSQALANMFIELEYLSETVNSFCGSSAVLDQQRLRICGL